MRTLILILACAVALPLWGQKRDTTTIERNGKKLQVIIIDEEEIEEEVEKDLEEMEDDLEEMEKDLEGMEFDWDKDDDEKDELDKVNTRWGMVDLGFSSYLYNGDKQTITDENINPLEQNIWRSFNFNIHIFKQKVSLISNYVNLMYGVGLNYHQYEFANSTVPVERTTQLRFNHTPTIDYDANQLRTWFLTVPLMLNFETNPRDSDKSFRFSAGGFGGLRISSNLNTKYDIYKVEVRDDFNLNQFRYGLAGEIGFGWINLYGNYALNGLFQEDSDGGYDVSPLNIGIQVVPF